MAKKTEERRCKIMTLWYAQPATEWTEALPIGNGRLGAMVYGGIEQEHLQLLLAQMDKCILWLQVEELRFHQ